MVRYVLVMVEGPVGSSRQVLKIDGGRIRQIREEKGLTQLYVASVVGVTTDTISRWENRKYPSIKRENALRLAEALEVSLQEILEGEQVDRSKGAGRDLPPTAHGKRTRLSPLQVGLFVAVSIVVGLLFFFAKSGLQGPSNAIVTATRSLPKYVAPGARFPVLIEIDDGGVETSVILKESMPRACSLVGYFPQASALTKGRGTLQWIMSVPKGGLDFVYVVHCSRGVDLGKQLRFSGTITSRGKDHANIPIEGELVTRVGPFHWADRNADGTIDDQEVLEAFDTLGRVKGLEADLRELETLWANGAYRWDPGKMEFYPLKEAHDGRR